MKNKRKLITKLMSELKIKNKFKHTLHRLSGIQLLAVGYLFVIFLGSFLLSLPIASRARTWTPYIDSLFTSTSATCVTGLITQDIFTHWSGFGQTIILILIQVGGIGFMTMVALVALFLKRKIGLYGRKVLMHSAGSMKIGGVINLVKRVLIGTAIFEGIGTLLLMIAFCPKLGFGMGLWFSLFHSISAFCNAGFDLMGRFSPHSSLTTMNDNPLVMLTLMALILVGGIGFFVWSDIWDSKGNPKKFQLHTKVVLVATAVIVIIPTILYMIFERNNLYKDMSFGQMLMTALFQSITPRTAGFNSVDTAALSDSSAILTMSLMFIGGNSGSTAGGIKLTTMLVLIASVFSSARQNGEVVLFKRRISSSSVKQASSIFLTYIMFMIIGTMVICAIQPEFGLKQVIFEVISAMGTVGLSMGITPHLTVASKLIVGLLMFVGRLGALSFALALGEKINNTTISRPVGKLMIG